MQEIKLKSLLSQVILLSSNWVSLAKSELLASEAGEIIKVENQIHAIIKSMNWL